MPRDQSPYEREDPRNFLKTIKYGAVFRKSFLVEAFKLYNQIRFMKVETNGENITLSNICFMPLSPENNNCAIMSIFNYFQVKNNNYENIFHVTNK